MTSKSILIFVLLGLIEGILGYARLVDPPARGMEHITKAGTPRRPKPPHVVSVYDYHLDCGGYVHQWIENGGKCGTCGDPYGERQEHMAGGIYATGAITRYYKQGNTMEAEVDFVNNLMGWMEFRICPNNDVNKQVTQECLDKHLLQMADGSGSRFKIESHMKTITVKLNLPSDLVCTQCVVQWKYNAGNRYDTDRSTNQSCMGCGPQEQYYNCADVAIATGPGNNDTVDPDFNKPVPSDNKKGKGNKNKDINTDKDQTTEVTDDDVNDKNAVNDVKDEAKIRSRRNPSQLGIQRFDSRNCHAVGEWAKHSGMDEWCRKKCEFGPQEQVVCIPGVCEC